MAKTKHFCEKILEGLKFGFLSIPQLLGTSDISVLVISVYFEFVFRVYNGVAFSKRNHKKKNDFSIGDIFLYNL